MTIIETTLEEKTLADLVEKKVITAQTEPVLTKVTIDAILTELKKPQAYGDIARKVGFEKCTKAQVVEVAQKRQEKITELSTPVEIKNTLDVAIG